MKKLPLVSILTPTFNRRKFIYQYLRNIKKQDYKGPIEVLIADDGEDKIEDLIPKNSIFRYINIAQKKPIGYKRNLLCGEAKGEILINMDDDDFYPSTRVSHAVEKLDKKEAYIAGCSKLYFYDESLKISENGPISDFHASAGTFAFFKEYLDKNKFDDKADVGEEFMFTHHFTNPLIQLDPFKTILVIAHSKNTYSKELVVRKKSKFKLSDFVKNPVEYEFYNTHIYSK
jgi:glycosyltransferase involved in cell wall biosynthesis